jgi:hypothetical protein
MNVDDTPELVFEQKGEVRTIAHEMYYELLLKEAAEK